MRVSRWSGDDVGAYRGGRGEDAVVGNQVGSGWRDEGGELLDEGHGFEDRSGRSVSKGVAEVIDDLAVFGLFEPVLGDRGSGRVSEESLESVAVASVGAGERGDIAPTVQDNNPANSGGILSNSIDGVACVSDNNVSELPDIAVETVVDSTIKDNVVQGNGRFGVINCVGKGHMSGNHAAWEEDVVPAERVVLTLTMMTFPGLGLQASSSSFRHLSHGQVEGIELRSHLHRDVG